MQSNLNTNISIIIDGDTARLIIAGPFDLDARKDFKDVSGLLLEDEDIHCIICEMGQTTDIGTGGMGMLYLLQERCNKVNKILRITHSIGKVKEWLIIANGDNFFRLD